MLSGTVEIDETYIGGKPRRGAHGRLKRGRGTRKTPVLALVERNGRVRSHRIESVSGRTLRLRIWAAVLSIAMIASFQPRSYALRSISAMNLAI